MAKDKGGFRFDRVSALGIGMLIGLGAATVDRRRKGQEKRSGAARRLAGQSPAEAAVRNWRRILACTFKEFNDDRIPQVAAGSAFFLLLALFPALGVFVSLYGLVGDVHGAQKQIADLRGVLPEGGVSVISDQINRLAMASHAKLGVAFFVSLLVSVWSANAGMKGLIAGLNVAYELRERRNFIELNLASLLLTAGGIALAIVVMAAVVAVPEVLSMLRLEALQGSSVLRWPLLLVLTAGLISVLYRWGPSPHGARWRWITPGGVVAAVCWMAMSLAFSFYVGRFGHYDKTYGSLGAVVGFMTWIWLSMMVVLLGAELNSEIEEQVGPSA